MPPNRLLASAIARAWSPFTYCLHQPYREGDLSCLANSSCPFLAAWFVTGNLVGVVMARRRRDRFPWWLLGVAFGALPVPLALEAEHGEQPAGRANSPSRRRTSRRQSLTSTTP